MELYRGFSDVPSSKLLNNTYRSMPRKPRDSHINVHKVSDDWFFREFGIRARSQTIFCTPDIEQAKQYGIPYKIFFPVYDSYSLIFSKYVHDFNEIEAQINDVSDDSEILNWLESKFYEMVTNVCDLPEDFSGEIMLFCNNYEVMEI